VHTDEQGTVVPWDKDFYVYYYVVKSLDEVDFAIFILFLGQGVFFFGGPWVPFFFLWLLNLLAFFAVLRVFPDVLFGRYVRDFLLDDYAFISEEELEELESHDQDVDFGHFGSFLVKNIKMRLIAEELEKRALNSELRYTSDDPEVLSQLRLEELEENIVKRKRQLQELLFGSNFFRDFSGYFFAYDNIEFDEDTIEDNLCIFTSDINLKYFSGSFFLESFLSLGFDRGVGLTFDIERVLIRDIVSGFSYFMFLYDFCDDDQLLDLRLRERYPENYLNTFISFRKAGTLSDFGFFNFIVYRSFLPLRKFFEYKIFTYLSILEFFFYLSFFGFLYYVIFFFNVYFYTFGSRFVITNWTWEAVFFVVFFCFVLVFVIIVVYSWRFFVFRRILKLFLVPFGVFVSFLFLFWEYFIYICLFVLRLVRFKRVVFFGNFFGLERIFILVSFDCTFIVKSISFLFFFFTLYRWCSSGWQFSIVDWFLFMYNSFVFFSLSRYNFFLFDTNSRNLMVANFAFRFCNKYSVNPWFIYIVFVPKDFFWGDFDLVDFLFRKSDFF
jgi:hypothetical protein